MLILSRRSSESIIVGDEVTITILSVKGKQVRIGIDAPPHIGVHREEIYQKIQDQDSGANGQSNASQESKESGVDPSNSD